MKTCLLLGIAAALVSAARGACDACVDGRCLRKQLLPAMGRGFAINRKTNEYFFTTTKSGQHYITQCRLNTLTCNETEILWDLRDLTVDQRTGDLYAAVDLRRRGLYKVDLVKKERTLLVDERIQHMVFKDKLYYSLRTDYWLAKGIYTYNGGIQQIVAGTEDYVVMEFVVDKNDDIFFRDYNQGTPLIRQLQNGTGTANYFCHQSHILSTDKDGNAIVFDVTIPLSRVNRVINDELVVVGAITELTDEPVFDGDNNLIYRYEASDTRRSYYLKQVNDVQCSTGRGKIEERHIISKLIRTTTPVTVVSTSTGTTPAHDTSNNNTKNTNQQQADQEGQKEGRKRKEGKQEEDQTCTCNTPKLPIVTVKVEFN